jgi:2'-5' RNA ligase
MSVPPGGESAPVRAFLALELPAAARVALEETIASLRAAMPGGVKWVLARNAHLTLHFVGRERRERLDQAVAALRRARLGNGYAASLGEVGVFPNLRSAHTIWVGLDQGISETVAIQARVAAVLGELAFSLESRPFRPHITVGRVRDHGRSGAAALPDLPARPARSVAFPVSRLALLVSRLGGPEPVYERLAIVDLPA